MASTFFGLSIAGSGLRAANAALNTTANNISNADTDGYSRQKVVQQAANALRIFDTYGCAGAGVKTLAIERLRDEFYDVKYRENETSLGEYGAKYYYMKMVQEYFNDDGKTGFSTVFTNLKVSLQEILKDSGEATAKQDFLGAATKLTEYFNSSAANLEKLQKDVNAEIKTKVEEINSISQEIVTLNKQINVIELSGAQPNELRDKRDNLVDRLSKIVDVDVKEYPVYDSNDPDRETGAYRYIVRIGGNQTLVDGGDRHVLLCEAREADNKVNQSDINGLYDIYWEDTGDLFNTANSQMGGELAGLLQLRDGNNNEGFYGTVAKGGLDHADVDKLDETGNPVKVTVQTVTVDVSAEHLKDLNKCNLAQAGTINIGNKLYRYSNWSFQVKADGKGNNTYSYTFELAEGEKISTNADDKAVSVGNNIDYQGIPYYMEQMNEWVRLFSRAVNSILKSGYTDDGKPGCLMFTTVYPDGKQGDFEYATDVTGKDASGVPDGVSDGVVDAWDIAEYEKLFSGGVLAHDGKYKISATDDGYHRMTAGGFTILNAIKKDAELLATKTDPNKTDGESQYDNITNILNTLTDAKKLSFRGADAGEFLTCVLGDITLAVDNAETFEETHTVLQNTLGNQRLSISGVDSDEEALSLVHYQDSLTLACKMISTFAEIYDQLILNTGV